MKVVESSPKPDLEHQIVLKPRSQNPFGFPERPFGPTRAEVNTKLFAAQSFLNKYQKQNLNAIDPEDFREDFLAWRESKTHDENLAGIERKIYGEVDFDYLSNLSAKERDNIGSNIRKYPVSANSAEAAKEFFWTGINRLAQEARRLETQSSDQKDNTAEITHANSQNSEVEPAFVKGGSVKEKPREDVTSILDLDQFVDEADKKLEQEEKTVTMFEAYMEYALAQFFERSNYVPGSHAEEDFENFRKSFKNYREAKLKAFEANGTAEFKVDAIRMLSLQNALLYVHNQIQDETNETDGQLQKMKDQKKFIKNAILSSPEENNNS